MSTVMLVRVLKLCGTSHLSRTGKIAINFIACSDVYQQQEQRRELGVGFSDLLHQLHLKVSDQAGFFASDTPLLSTETQTQ